MVLLVVVYYISYISPFNYLNLGEANTDALTINGLNIL